MPWEFGAKNEETRNVKEKSQLSNPLDFTSKRILENAVRTILPSLNRVQSITLQSGDVSFDVRNSDTMSISASAAVSITTITNGYDGQVLKLIFNDSNVTFVHDASGADNTIDLGGANYTSTNRNTLSLIFNGTNWFLGTIGLLSASIGSVGGWTIAAGSLSSGSVSLNSTNQTLLIGSATAPLTGTGIFIGLDGSDYEFRVGDPSGDFTHYDGTNWSVNIVQSPDDENLVAFWPLNEGRGTDAEDLTVNGNHLTLRGSMTDADWIAGIVGTALDFEGTDDFADIASPSFIDDTAGAVSLWVKFDNNTQSAMPFSISVDGATDDEFQIAYRGDVSDEFRIILVVNGSTTLDLRSPNNTITDTNWHHLVLTSDGSTIKLYIDSVDRTLTASTGTNTGQWFSDATQADVCTIGALQRASNSDFIDGKIDEIRVYSSNLTAKQVKGLFNSPTGNVPKISRVLKMIYGDGSDGDTVISSNTTLARDMYYKNLTVNSGITLTAAGYRPFVSGLTINDGTIAHQGNNGANGGASTGVENAGGAALAAAYLGATGAGGDGRAGNINQTGGSGGAVTSSLGAGAGNGGAGDGSGAGGSGASVTSIPATSGSFRVLPSIIYLYDFIVGARITGGAGAGGGGSGGGGGAGDVSEGGGGGGGGGVLLIASRLIINNGTIIVGGGDGGNGGPTHQGGQGGGGGGGGGGFLALVYQSYSGSGTKTANGGTGGTATATGVAGSNGSNGTVVELQV